MGPVQADRRVADVDVELGEFIPDPWASPGWVIPPHGLDERPHIGIYPRTPALASALPPPEQAKPSVVPGDHRGWPDDR